MIILSFVFYRKTPQLRQPYLISFADIQKRAWESICYSSHVQRLWHRPISQNEQRRSPRLYVNTIIIAESP